MSELKSQLQDNKQSVSRLKKRLEDDIKQAMKAKEAMKIGVLRFIAAAIKQREIDERIVLSDAEIIDVLVKLTKQHREAIEQFSQAGRHDLVDKEKLELEIIQSYLPEQLSSEALDALIKKAIDDSAATSIKDMAKVMAALRAEVQGRCDMSQVSQKIKSLLSEK